MNTIDDKQMTYSFPDMNPNRRLRELILYIAGKCANDPYFGRTKLNKILYFADVAAYIRTGKPISGAEYIKLQNGPVPKMAKDLLESMTNANEVFIQLTPIIEYTQQRVIARREPDLDIFTAREIDILHDVIDALQNKNAGEVSDLSHGIAWQTTEMMHSIPYEAALLSDEPLDEDDIAAAQELIRKHGWKV